MHRHVYIEHIFVLTLLLERYRTASWQERYEKWKIARPIINIRQV